MKKKIIKLLVIFIIIPLAIVVYSRLRIYAKNKLYPNVIVEEFNDLTSWRIFDNGGNRQISSVAIYNEGYNDNSSVRIHSEKIKELKIFKKFKIDRNAFYKVSVMAKINATYFGTGVSIGGHNCWENYYLNNTYGDWQEFSFYMRKGSVGEDLELSLGMGGNNLDSSGDILFDNLRIEKVEEVPEGENIIVFHNWYEEYEPRTKLSDFQIKTLIIIISSIVAIILLFINKSLKNIVDEKEENLIESNRNTKDSNEIKDNNESSDKNSDTNIEN